MIDYSKDFSKEKGATEFIVVIKFFPFKSSSKIGGLYERDSEVDNKAKIRIDSSMSTMDQVRVLFHELYHLVCDLFFNQFTLALKEEDEERAADAAACDSADHLWTMVGGTRKLKK